MVKLRRAVPEDAPRLVEIYGYYVEKTAISFEYTVPSPEEFRGRMERIMRRYPYLVAEVDGRVAGYAYARGLRGPGCLRLGLRADHLLRPGGPKVRAGPGAV